MEQQKVELIHDLCVSATQPVRANIVALLFGKVCMTVPLAERGMLIKQLMQPMGLWSLAAIANGVFASIRFQGSFNNRQPRMEDVQAIEEKDVVALVDHVQQVSTHALNGMAQILTSSPVLAGSAAAIALIKILVDLERSSRDDDPRICSNPHFPERRLNSHRSGSD
jgi:hypothetical protein